MLKSHQKVTDTYSVSKQVLLLSPTVITQVLHHLRLGYMIALIVRRPLTKTWDDFVSTKNAVTSPTANRSKTKNPSTT